MYSSPSQDLFDIDDFLRSEYLQSEFLIGWSDGAFSATKASPSSDPGSDLGPFQSDLTIHSSDGVFFSVHRERLLAASENRLGGLVPPTAGNAGKASTDPKIVIELHEDSGVIDTILRAVYHMPFSHTYVPLKSLSAALDAMTEYGILPHNFVNPSYPLYFALLSFALTSPLELYALAASHNLEELAVSVSEYLLPLELSSISDDIARGIGPVYLKRLFLLHRRRTDALKRLLLAPPAPHTPTQSCDQNEQKKLIRAWALASAYIAWDAHPDMAPMAMEETLIAVQEQLSCEVCIQLLRRRIRDLISQWSLVKRTI